MRFEKSAAIKTMSFVVATLFATISLLQGCGGGGTTSSVAPPPATLQAAPSAPQISSLSPVDATVGGPSLTLKVRGSGFTAGSTVRWNGVSLTTTFIAADELDATVNASAISASGTAQIQAATASASSNPVSFTIKNGLPSIQSITPATALVGSLNMTITVDGQGFVPTSIIQWNGAPSATTFVSATQLTATVPSSALASAGSVAIDVTSPAPGGGTSSSVSFAVNNPAPTLQAINPISAPAGTANLSVTVTGTGFVSGSIVEWNGAALATTFANNTTLQISLTSSELAAAGTATVRVSNPMPGGGTSSSVSFAVNNPAPTLQAINPISAPAGTANLSVTVTGTGFVSGSIVEWNGAALATTFANNTTLQITLTSNDLAAVGTATVRVSNSAPGGGATSSLSFSIENGIPTLTSVAQNSAYAGGAGFTITVDGSYFVPGSRLEWNGAPLTTTFVGASQLTAEVTADKILQAGSKQLTVWNPPPSGGFSNAVVFTVDPVTNTFVYVAQPAEGLIARMVVDPVTSQLRPDGFDAVLQPGSGLWALQLDRSRRFLYTLDMTNSKLMSFAVNALNGVLTPIPGATVSTGTDPVAIVSHPSGKFVYVANMTSSDVSAYSQDQNTGALQPIPGSPFAAGSSPLGIVMDDAGKFAFVTNYGSDTISVYSVAPSGALIAVPGSPFASVGNGPWSPALDPSGRFLFVPNYDSADVSVYKVDAAGSLTPVTGSPYQVGAFPTFASVDPTGRYLYVTDPNDFMQGLVHVLAVDQASGQLTPAGSPFAVGAYPNRMAFSNNGQRAFVTNYSSWELMVFDVSAQNGSLTLAERLPTRMDPENLVILEGGTPYSVAPRFAYTSHTLANRISLFQVDPISGALGWVQSVNSASPKALANHPSGALLYSRDSQAGTLSAQQIDASSGTMAPAAGASGNVGAGPGAVVFESTKRFGYVLNVAQGEISQYTVDASTGAFTLQNTVAVGAAPSAIVIEPTGRYLYVSFPSSGEVKVYVIGTDGSFSLRSTVNVGAGVTHLAADPNGRFIAVTLPAQGELRLYSIFAPMGDLNHATTVFPGSSPSAITFDPSGKFLLAADSAANTVSVYTVDASSGQLQQTATTPAGSAPSFVTIDPSNQFVYISNAGSSDVSICRLNTQSGSLQLLNTMSVSSAPGAMWIRGIAQ